MNKSLFEIKLFDAGDLYQGIQHPYNYIFSLLGAAGFSVEFTEYQFSNNSFVFLSPFYDRIR